MLRLLVLGCLCVGSLGFVARPPMPENRIVGGVQTTIEAHPHQLSFQRYDSHYCGASIIGRSWAITAGHCVGSSIEGFTIRAGSASVNGGKRYTVIRIIRHPQYNGYTIDYDVALIQIAEEFPQNKTINHIALASVELADNSTVTVTGWGALSQGGAGSNVLMQVSVPVVNRKACAEAYQYVGDVTERMICAGIEKGGKDACQGDSGGPLTAGNVLYGIVSWGYGCAQPKYPGVYTNVVAVRSWINSITGI